MFKPEVGERITLFGKDYSLQQHPGAIKGMPYIAQGRKARVHQYKDAQGKLWALKVFLTKYQNPELLSSVERLKELKAEPGLDVANRRIVTPDDPLVTKYPALKYATLMPWVDGTTWFDLLAMANNQQLRWSLDQAKPLCMRFLTIMQRLETRGYAHTDIASGNVTFRYASPLDVQLIDLEDMYQPGIPVPQYQNMGTEGYGHPSHASCFCPEGDRFASAMLAAEVLVLSNRELAQWATSDGYFRGEDRQARFDQVYPWLTSVVPQFARQFAEAWKADTLSNCPTIQTLAESLHKDGVGDVEDSGRRQKVDHNPAKSDVEWVPFISDAGHSVYAEQEQGSQEQTQNDQDDPKQLHRKVVAPRANPLKLVMTIIVGFIIGVLGGVIGVIGYLGLYLRGQSLNPTGTPAIIVIIVVTLFVWIGVVWLAKPLWKPKQ